MSLILLSTWYQWQPWIQILFINFGSWLWEIRNWDFGLRLVNNVHRERLGRAIPNNGDNSKVRALTADLQACRLHAALAGTGLRLIAALFSQNWNLPFGVLFIFWFAQALCLWSAARPYFNCTPCTIFAMMIMDRGKVAKYQLEREWLLSQFLSCHFMERLWC